MPGVTGSIEAAATRDDVLFVGYDEHVMNIVSEIVLPFGLKISTSFGPRLTVIVTDVNPADFYTSNETIRCIWMDAEASDV